MASEANLGTPSSASVSSRRSPPTHSVVRTRREVASGTTRGAKTRLAKAPSSTAVNFSAFAASSS